MYGKGGVEEMKGESKEVKASKGIGEEKTERIKGKEVGEEMTQKVRGT